MPPKGTRGRWHEVPNEVILLILFHLISLLRRQLPLTPFGCSATLQGKPKQGYFICQCSFSTGHQEDLTEEVSLGVGHTV
jgi:hypothetical protein